MQTIAEETSTEQKTRELCQAILDRPDFPELRRKMDAFMNDEGAKFQYQMLNDRGQMLQSKQPSDKEVPTLSNGKPAYSADAHNRTVGQYMDSVAGP